MKQREKVELGSGPQWMRDHLRNEAGMNTEPLFQWGWGTGEKVSTRGYVWYSNPGNSIIPDKQWMKAGNER